MYRIVHNEQTDIYRVEKRGMLGWAFVTDSDTGDYLGFSNLEKARGWVRGKARRSNTTTRRWRVVSDCQV